MKAQLSCSTDDRSREVELFCADRLSKNLAPDPLVEAWLRSDLVELNRVSLFGSAKVLLISRLSSKKETIFYFIFSLFLVTD